jgi:two-component system response regulator HydG
MPTLPFEPIYLTAIVMGLFSSFHCIGMCGSIIGTLTLSLSREVRTLKRLLAPFVLSYNLGRISSYTMAGLIAGSLRYALELPFGPQGYRVLQVAASLVMAACGCYIAGWFPRFAYLERLGARLWRLLEPLGRQVLPVANLSQAFLFGMIWGWLPCGLVYTALTLAATAGSPTRGALTMTAFGAGTLPAVMGVGIMTNWMVRLARMRRFRVGAGVFVVLLAVLAAYPNLTPQVMQHIRTMGVDVMDKFKALIGKAPNFEALLRSARMVAATDVTVLIIGETGTGKEMLAQAIQQSSPRAEAPFITINCAALPELLAESELFGHRKGAFTGAVSNQTGKLQAAAGGTVFLDEIDSMPYPLQGKLLRFLESGECQPVGATATERVDVRIIAATNTDLEQKIERGEFRRDLYYRLNVVPLEIPPLRERREDIPLLAEHFLHSAASEHNLPPAKLSKAALQALVNYWWPGNVRELRNVCERLAILLAGYTIEPTNLPSEITASTRTYGRSKISLPACGLSLEEVEIDLIRQALERTGGNRTRSARLLGISRDTLLYRMQKYGIT